VYIEYWYVAELLTMQIHTLFVSQLLLLLHASLTKLYQIRTTVIPVTFPLDVHHMITL